MAMLGAPCSPCCITGICFGQNEYPACTFPPGTIIRAVVSGVTGDGTYQSWGEAVQDPFNGTWCIVNSDADRCVFYSYECPCGTLAGFSPPWTHPPSTSLALTFCNSAANTQPCSPGNPARLKVQFRTAAAAPVVSQPPVIQFQPTMSSIATLCESLRAGETQTLQNAYADQNWAQCPSGQPGYTPWSFGNASITLSLDSNCTDALTARTCGWWCNGRGHAGNLDRTPPAEMRLVVSQSGNTNVLPNGTWFLQLYDAGYRYLGNQMQSNDWYLTPARRSFRTATTAPCSPPATNELYWNLQGYSLGAANPAGAGSLNAIISVPDTGPSCQPPQNDETVTVRLIGAPWIQFTARFSVSAA